MKIAVLGTGMVGQALAGRLAELGHDVTVGTRDVSDTLSRTALDAMGNPPYSAWAAEHTDVKLATFADAAADAELIVNATSGGVSIGVLTAAGAENLSGKVLLDIANPLDFSRVCRRPCSSRTPTASASRSRPHSRTPAWSRR